MWPHSDATAQLGGQTFTVRLATTPPERERGLSGIRSLPERQGMLFVFERDGIWQFWMKDMHISLDIIWLDANKKIVHIAQDVSPESYPRIFESPVAARYVLEVNAGVSRQLNLSVGSPADFTLPPGRDGMIKL